MRDRIYSLLLLAALTVLVAACGGDSQNEADTGTEGNVTTSDATEVAAPSGGHAGHASAQDSSTPQANVEADPDLAFIDAIIVHHGSAIVMAEIAQELAEHEDIRNLADEIITAQRQEIDQMQVWRDEWFPNAPETDLSSMGDMAGMSMSEADMQMMRDAEDFDQMFMEMMIEHHESAIQMAQDLRQTTERPELQELTANIIETQQAEIDQMQQWLEEWYSE